MLDWNRPMLNSGPRPKYITFDCYGTLVQWHAALERGVRGVLAEHREVPPQTDTEVIELVDALRSHSMALQERLPYQTYKTILRSSLSYVTAQRGLSPAPHDGEVLLSFLRDIPPHPEVPATLERLRTQFRLAIISNSDDDLIAATVASLGIPINHVVTAQQARAYKPDHRLFRHAHAVMGVTPAETVHVGMGQVTDLKVCHELDIRAVWINRLAEELNEAWAPKAVLPDLSTLPALLML